MSRTYRFFTRHLLSESLSQNPARPFHLTESLEPEIFFQLSKVLRIKTNDKIVLIPFHQASGTALSQPKLEYHYAVQDIQKKELILHLEQKVKNENELNFELGLILALPNKPDKLEFILQKAVELGVAKIILVEADFSQMKHHLREDRLQKILIEAAEQSERAIVPSLELAGKLTDYLAKMDSLGCEKILVAMERLKVEKSREVQENNQYFPVALGSAVQILIGPEGGFSEEEKKLFEQLGMRTFSLGKTVLRMETAAILALGIAAIFSHR